MAMAAARAADPHQREECVEDLVEDRFVPIVLDKRDPQRGTQDLPVRQYTRLACAPHRVEHLGDRDAHAAEAQQPHEPVQGGFHDEA